MCLSAAAASSAAAAAAECFAGVMNKVSLSL